MDSKTNIRVTLSIVFLRLNSPFSSHLVSRVLLSSPLSSRGRWVPWEDGFLLQQPVPLFMYYSIGIPSNTFELHFMLCSVSFGMISLDTACFGTAGLHAWRTHTSWYPRGCLSPCSALSTGSAVIFHCLFAGRPVSLSRVTLVQVLLGSSYALSVTFLTYFCLMEGRHRLSANSGIWWLYTYVI